MRPGVFKCASEHTLPKEVYARVTEVSVGKIKKEVKREFHDPRSRSKCIKNKSLYYCA